MTVRNQVAALSAPLEIGNMYDIKVTLASTAIQAAIIAIQTGNNEIALKFLAIAVKSLEEAKS